jgi:hypothetical protein
MIRSHSACVNPEFAIVVLVAGEGRCAPSMIMIQSGDARKLTLGSLKYMQEIECLKCVTRWFLPDIQGEPPLMKVFTEAIFSKAFSVIKGTDYNRVAQQMREDDFVLFYEVVLTEDKRWEYLRDRIFPSLARYLRYKSMDPESGSGLIVSVFHGELCYLIDAPSFFEAFREVEGMDRDAFRLRVAGWLSEQGKTESMLLTA